MTQDGRRPTVLHFTGYNEDLGGVLNYIRAASLHNGARNMLVVGRDFKQVRGPRLPLLRVPSMNAESLYKPHTSAWCLVLAIRFHLLLQKHPHVIFHGHSRAGLIIAQWLNFWGHTRSLATVHANGRHRWFYRWMRLLLGERLTFLCPSMKRYYSLAETSWKNCFPGAPVSTEFRHKPKASEPILKVGGLGSLVCWKRWELMLNALAQMPDSLRQRIHFSHAGPTLPGTESHDYVAFLRDETARLGLNRCVSWHGRIEDTRAYLRELDALIICSDSEPWGLTMLEALFQGVPVLASASGGPSDLIRDGDNGYLFTDGDVQALADLLCDLALGERSLPEIDVQALQCFSAHAFGARWQQCYLKILG